MFLKFFFILMLNFLIVSKSDAEDLVYQEDFSEQLMICIIGIVTGSLKAPLKITLLHEITKVSY